MLLAIALYADAARVPARYAVETARTRFLMHRVPRLNNSRGHPSCRTFHKRHKSSPDDLTDLISTRELRKPDKVRSMTTRYALRGLRSCEPRLTAKSRPPLGMFGEPLTHSHFHSLMSTACLIRQRMRTGILTRKNLT